MKKRTELEVMERIQRLMSGLPSTAAVRVADWTYARWGTGMFVTKKVGSTVVERHVEEVERLVTGGLLPDSFETNFSRWIVSNVLTTEPYDMQALEDLCGAGPLTDFMRAYTYEALFHLIGRQHDPDEEACLRVFYDDLRQHLGLAFNPPDQA